MAVPRGPAPRRERMPRVRSRSTTPTTAPVLATLNGPKTGSACTYTAAAACAEWVVAPASSIGWPNATARPLQVKVVVPTADRVASPYDAAAATLLPPKMAEAPAAPYADALPVLTRWPVRRCSRCTSDVAP